MEKALKFLKRMKQTDTPYNFRECELDEAIADLEEAIKPKTCVGCIDEEITSNRCEQCARLVRDFYVPKENA